MVPTVRGPSRRASKIERRDISEKPRNSLALSAVADRTRVGICRAPSIIISLYNDMIIEKERLVKGEAEPTLPLTLLAM
jgi:hypothetical protein